ncbi:MAG: DUF459 domain-containing protein [Rhizobiaceae bacterium]|nr:DUF459 domain-containing protein [Rhizobiaceae bacterium]
MAARSSIRFALRPLVFLAILAAALVLSEPLLTSAPAFAQETGQRFWLLRKLFAPRKVERLEPQQPAPAKKKRTPRAPAEPAIPQVEKTPDAKVVLVVGDFLASGLAEGLTAVFAENAGVRIVDRSKSSSGLVRSDVMDWPRGITAVVEEVKPAAVVVMLGSNDRQQMRVGESREASLSDAWTKEYGARSATLAKAIGDTRVPLLWVGMPPFKSTKMSSDMLAFNDMYQTAAEAADGEFIDIWDGFVDENGAYVGTGPDINGQPVRLRASDGINMTRAGKRKVAFYLEKSLNRLLGVGPGSDGIAPLVPALPGAVAPVDPASIDRTPPIALSDPELDGGGELLGAAPATPAQMGSVGERLFDTAKAKPVLGRADEFIWPAKALTATLPPPAADTTTAIAR